MVSPTRARPRPKTGGSPLAVDAIAVTGFKSFRDRTEISLRPLTILAGQNSAGKSSILQPLLIAKQTLEATWDPGALLIDGPCFRGATADGLLWRGRRRDDHARAWDLELVRGDDKVATRYARSAVGGFALEETVWHRGDARLQLRSLVEDLQWSEAARRFAVEALGLGFAPPDRWSVMPHATRVAHELVMGPMLQPELQVPIGSPFPAAAVEGILHLPGLRGNPSRTYPITGSDARYPGPFPPYAASALLTLQAEDPARAAAIGEDLRLLGVTWKAVASRFQHSDTHVEIRVGRLPNPQQGGAMDLVNIADVGFGASQVLPVVVALRVARRGQMVHIEQPELHLHPNAQVRMARLLVQAANRGVQVVVETHSSAILRAVQLAVARGDLAPSKVALHWFTRDAEGASQVRTADLDRTGSFGDWPVDFADVELQLERDFVDASFAAEEAG